MRRIPLNFLGVTIFAALFANLISAEHAIRNHLAQASVDCRQGRRIMGAMSRYYGPVTDRASCESACMQRGEPANSACYAICSQCYEEQSLSSAEQENPGNDIFPAATPTERRLLRYLVKNGEKSTNELGRTYELTLAKKDRKKMKFSGIVKSVTAEKACGVELKEKDGTPMSGLRVIMSSEAAMKKCRKLKSGDKLTVIPANMNYTFIPKNPFTGKSNVGMLFVTTP